MGFETFDQVGSKSYINFAVSFRIKHVNCINHELSKIKRRYDLDKISSKFNSAIKLKASLKEAL